MISKASALGQNNVVFESSILKEMHKKEDSLLESIFAKHHNTMVTDDIENKYCRMMIFNVLTQAYAR